MEGGTEGGTEGSSRPGNVWRIAGGEEGVARRGWRVAGGAACRCYDLRRQELAVERLQGARLDARRAQLQTAADVEPAQRGAAAAQLLERGVAEARAAGKADLGEVRPVDVRGGEMVAMREVDLLQAHLRCGGDAR